MHIMNHCWNWAFSSSGLEVGLPAFQLPMFAKCDALKEICSTCLSKESTPFVKSKPPLPTRSLRSLRAAARSTSSALCLHHAHPFVAAEEKRPVSCREAEGLVTELWSPRSVTIYWYQFCIMLASCPSLRCSCRKIPVSCRAAEGLLTQLWCPRFVTMVVWDCCKPTNTCRDWAFSNSGLEVGLPAFQLPMFENVTHCPKEICSTCLFQESIPAIPLGNAKHPLLVRSLRLLRAAARSTSSALCFHYACKGSHPFVEDSAFVSYAEKHRFGHGVVVSKVCYGILECVFFPICHVDYQKVSGSSF